ncbi:hypothetical protein GCM10010358_76130 [Streptomyces minutiscleroticus]|uniref:Uncharacterized protein n=1 Tax=Streptomyces minutiscleroticus TaxID=68238 RepID=A0A918P1M3_9ACTN|nr:hypothetical protein GCM10010358_76130 [Streptomyces minutiscleroticus]
MANNRPRLVKPAPSWADVGFTHLPWIVLPPKGETFIAWTCKRQRTSRFPERDSPSYPVLKAIDATAGGDAHPCRPA